MLVNESRQGRARARIRAGGQGPQARGKAGGNSTTFRRAQGGPGRTRARRAQGRNIVLSSSPLLEAPAPPGWSLFGGGPHVRGLLYLALLLCASEVEGLKSCPPTVGGRPMP